MTWLGRMRQLVNVQTEVGPLAWAIVTFAVVRFGLTILTKRVPFGPKMYRVREYPRLGTRWYERAIFGDVAKFFRDPPGVAHLQFTAEARRVLKDKDAQAYFYLGVAPRVMLANPQDVRYVLYEEPERFEKDAMTGMLEPVLGKHGLVTIIDESYHTEQRRAVGHAFGSSAVRAIAATTMREHFTAMVKSLRAEPATRDGTPQRLDVVFDGAALKIISEAAFNTRDFSTIRTELRDFGKLVAFHPMFVLGPRTVNRLPLERNRVAARVRKLVDAVLAPSLQSDAPRETDGESADTGGGAQRPKMLLELLKANGELSPTQILDHAITFLFAGHDTTATALMWFSYYMAVHPRVQEALHEELAAAFTADTTPSVSQLASLPYLDAVIYEVLRFRPPVTVIVRTPRQDVVLPATKTFLPAGIGLAIPIYALQHDPDVYGSDVSEFRPERWLDDPELKERTQPCSWMPFGGGKRACIGREFAMYELQLGAALMVRNFNIALPPDEPEPVGVAGVVVKAKTPIRFKVTLRA